MKRVRVGIVGVGKIARDQHIPVMRESTTFEFAACASRNANIEGVASFSNLEEMLDGCPDLDAIAICTPPHVHYEAAKLALQRGKHVFLEKPPCATTAQLERLAVHARKADRTLFQSWHSQYAAGVDAARHWLKSRAIRGIHVVWREDVRQWHPGQVWIWEAGGFGVFDPGINALSILTKIVPQHIFVKEANLFVPANCESPIAADLVLDMESGARISTAFDFRHKGVQTWDIDVETDDGALKLSEGGNILFIDGKRVVTDHGPLGEYAGLYRCFAELIEQNKSEVDARPFQLVADAFLIGKRIVVDRFDP